MAMTAEALYTMTTLMHTSSSVAVNRTLSLFSFRAILRDPGAVRWRGLKPAPYSPTDEPDRKPVRASRSAWPSGPADNGDIVKGRLRLNRNKPRRTARHVSIVHKTARQ